jgi:hypothetical protein
MLLASPAENLSQKIKRGFAQRQSLLFSGGSMQLPVTLSSMKSEI